MPATGQTFSRVAAGAERWTAKRAIPVIYPRARLAVRGAGWARVSEPRFGRVARPGVVKGSQPASVNSRISPRLYAMWWFPAHAALYARCEKSERATRRQRSQWRRARAVIRDDDIAGEIEGGAARKVRESNRDRGFCAEGRNPHKYQGLAVVRLFGLCVREAPAFCSLCALLAPMSVQDA